MTFAKTLPDFTTLILEKQAALGNDASLDVVIEALLVDAATGFHGLLRTDYDAPDFRRVAKTIPSWRWIGRGMRREAGPLIVAQVSNAKRTAPSLPVSTKLRSRVYLVLDVVRALIKPIARSGIGASPDDLWRLLFLDALGIAMPDIAEALRERRTPNSKERRRAKDDKYLWKLRRRALVAVANSVAPLLPSV
jgi:hypothetical protein